MTDILSELGIKNHITPEETKRLIEELKKIPPSKLSIKHSIPEGTMQKFMESKEKLKVSLEKVAPNIDFDIFIKFLITSPIEIDRLNFETIVKLITLLESLIPVKEAFSDIEASITINQPKENEMEIDSGKYLQFIINIVFPIFMAFLTQYQTYQTPEQLNRIEDLLEQYIEQHQEEQIIESDFIIELDKYDYGTRT